jgi:hypothetical protein
MFTACALALHGSGSDTEGGSALPRGVGIQRRNHLGEGVGLMLVWITSVPENHLALNRSRATLLHNVGQFVRQ